MEKTNPFYDFCIPLNPDKAQMIGLVKELDDLGYRTIAIEQIFDHSKKDAKKSNDIFPPPVDLEFLKEISKKMKIFHRLTIIYTDVAVSHAMTNSVNLKKYHLIAGQPKTDASLNHCCTIFNGDIITFDPENNKMLVNRKTYQVAVKRGMCFEIKYSRAIANSNDRKTMIKIAHNYHSKGKSKNVIFSSGASNKFELRGPYDIANLALIFGLSEEQGKAAVSTQCRQLYLKAESRRMGKTIMFVKQIGPTILSSSEGSGSSDSDSESEFEKIENEDEDIATHPHKKKKLS